ncbi:MAG TPA: hypothetical protein VNW97_09300 [Candidatus Saccharimonadales bacterium]|jgi:hypothetical protein|nr:hypothetical protein [Candidatus Saccharimonadales bacterium]
MPPTAERKGMPPKLIYLDTNLWNALCDQSVSPARVVEGLASQNARLTLGNEAVYEMAKTFRDSGDEGRARGMALFSHVYQYLAGQIPFVRVNMELVAAEMWALQRGSSMPETLLSPDDYATTRAELENLAHGELSQRVMEHIEWRVASAEATRSGQIAYLKDWPDVKRQLTNVSPEQFPQWLDVELRSQSSREHLAGQIKEHFPKATLEETAEWAQALLGSPIGRVAKAIVRRMLYYNWRCAHRESVSKDIYFDSNHILNASYADVYATKESKQAEYARLLLTPSTRIAIYDGVQGIEQWLVEQAATDLIGDGD